MDLTRVYKTIVWLESLVWIIDSAINLLIVILELAINIFNSNFGKPVLIPIVWFDRVI